MPSRTAVNLSSQTVLKLSKLKNIVGLKEAYVDLKGTKNLKKNIKKSFLIFSGDDESFLDLVCFSSGDGVISVISNAFPKKIAELEQRAFKKEKLCLKEFQKLKSLLKAVYTETNPIGIKELLFQNKVIRSPETRLPLTSFSKENSLKLKKELSLLKKRGVLC